MIEIESLYEMDKGTLSDDGERQLLMELKKIRTKYVPYFDRVGPGLSNVVTELKRELDKTLLPALTKALPKATDNRFIEVFCDVRIYPASKEAKIFKKSNDWSGCTLTVLVSFVLSIPMNDSLDSMTRASLVSLFEESSWDPSIEKLRKKLKLREKLNVEIVSEVMGSCSLDEFQPSEFNGFELEIIFDGCPATKFSRLKDQAKGRVISLKKYSKDNFIGSPEDITADNAEDSVPLLIAAIANALGVKNIDYRNLERSDNLYALMGFHESLTKSLVGSIMMHFDTLSIIGGDRMITVGNAIDFAIETLQFRDQDS